MFLFPALTIGFLFVAVPLLVHLINMMRHRRQSWAAMDFLLASYKKQKKWIILRQLLLLLARTAVAVILIAMLCGWVGNRQLLGVLGGQKVHHVVILDDSYSMLDRSVAKSAYELALTSLRSLTERLATSDGVHQLTVLRSSRASLVVRGGGASGDAAADLVVQTISADTGLIDRLLNTLPSSLSTDLVPVMQLAGELIGNTPADETVLYLLSDFRKRDWESTEQLDEIFQSLADNQVQIRGIDCAGPTAANLGVVRLAPLPDSWVAGVPVQVEFAIRNFGVTTARNVNVSARLIQYGPGINGPQPNAQYSGVVNSLPSTIIEKIEPGSEVVRKFQVFIPEPGTHAIEIRLPDDALAIDNQRVCTLPLTDTQRVLIVDGNTSHKGGGYHLESVLKPGGQVRTGAIPEVRPLSFLRSVSGDDLRAYRAIYLIDLPELSENGVSALSNYVRQGGGVAWFLGPDTPTKRFNEVLLASDRNLLPGALLGPERLSSAQNAGGSDIALVRPHWLSEPFVPLGNAVFSRVGIHSTFSIDLQDKRVSHDSPPRSVLNRRDGKPLLLQHRVGRGRVITLLTGLDGRWTNWTSDPTFVVLLLRANAFLSSDNTQPTSRWVDETFPLKLSSQKYIPQLSLLIASSFPPRVPLDMQATKAGNEWLLEISPTETAISGEDYLDLILTPGLSEFWLTRLDGRAEVRTHATVLRSAEGDLTRAEKSAMRRAALPARLRFVSANEMVKQSQGVAGSTTLLVLLAILGILLAGEQALAYWASYHPPLTGGQQ